MEKFKIDHFEKEHGANSFPQFRSLDIEAAHHALELMKRRLGLPAGVNVLDVLKTVDQMSFEVDGVNATEDSFDLKAVLALLGFSAATVFVNWYRFDRVDEFGTEDLCKHFGSIFYPSSDDLEIMDSTLTWLVSIRHNGAVKALILC